MAVELAIPWALQQKVTMMRDPRERIFFLNAGIVECIKQKLGPGTTHFVGGDYDDFTLANGDTVGTVFMAEEHLPDYFKNGAPANPGDEVSVVLGDNQALVNRLFEILQECATGKVDLADVRRGVAQREASKVYKTLFKGTPLTRETAALVANMAATKKFEGGRRKTARKTKKTKKAKKTLKRRR